MHFSLNHQITPLLYCKRETNSVDFWIITHLYFNLLRTSTFKWIINFSQKIYFSGYPSLHLLVLTLVLFPKNQTCYLSAEKLGFHMIATIAAVSPDSSAMWATGKLPECIANPSLIPRWRPTMWSIRTSSLKKFSNATVYIDKFFKDYQDKYIRMNYLN